MPRATAVRSQGPNGCSASARSAPSSPVAPLEEFCTAAATNKTPTTARADTQRTLLRNQIQDLQTQLNNYQTTVVTPGQLAGAASVPAAGPPR